MPRLLLLQLRQLGPLTPAWQGGRKGECSALVGQAAAGIRQASPMVCCCDLQSTAAVCCIARQSALQCRRSTSTATVYRQTKHAPRGQRPDSSIFQGLDLAAACGQGQALVYAYRHIGRRCNTHLRLPPSRTQQWSCAVATAVQCRVVSCSTAGSAVAGLMLLHRCDVGRHLAVSATSARPACNVPSQTSQPSWPARW